MFRKKQAKQANIALCYIRQSYTRDGDDKNSPERQRANIERICQEHNWTPEWYEDTDGHKSGRKVQNRPGWLALEKRLEDADVVALVANDLARVHRKGWRVGDLIEKLERYQIALVLAAPASAEAGRIVRASVALAQAMDLNVIAVGVETAEQYRFLQSWGCREAQGFLFMPPMAPMQALQVWRGQEPQ
jgi:DNA invertase Pin-like site-specific DNA recombinase